MRLSAAVDHIKIVRRRIVSDGISVDGHFDLAYCLIAIAVIHSNGRSVAFHDEKLFQILEVKNGVRRLHILNGVNELFCVGVKNLNLSIFFRREKEPVSIDIGRKMVKIAVFEPRQRDRLYQL